MLIVYILCCFTFRNVVNEVDNNTVVIVIGDHGMTESGMYFFLNISRISSSSKVLINLPSFLLFYSLKWMFQYDYTDINFSFEIGVSISIFNVFYDNKYLFTF